MCPWLSCDYRDLPASASFPSAELKACATTAEFLRDSKSAEELRLSPKHLRCCLDAEMLARRLRVKKACCSVNAGVVSTQTPTPATPAQDT